MATLGLTRFGIGVGYGEIGTTSATTKTYNGFNFTSDDPTAQANEAARFVRGGGSTMPGLVGLLGESYVFSELDLIKRNSVNGGAN